MNTMTAHAGALLKPTPAVLGSSSRRQLSQPRVPCRPVQAAAADTKQKEEKKEKAPFKAPALDPSTPSPIFGGSTGGLLRKAQVLLDSAKLRCCGTAANSSEASVLCVAD